MKRVAVPKYLGGVAACVLAASTFAPMMSVSLREGTHATPFGARIGLLYAALALGAALASIKGAYWIACAFGAFAFVNGLLLWALTYRGIADARGQVWARPGWGFVPLLGAAAVLATLPLWARVTERIARPSA